MRSSSDAGFREFPMAASMHMLLSRIFRLPLLEPVVRSEGRQPCRFEKSGL